MFATLTSWLRGTHRTTPEPDSRRWRPTLTRLEQRDNPSGGLDLSFNATGKQTLDFGFVDQAKAVAVQADGKILVAGSDDGGSPDFAIARFNPNGSLDTSFGTNGKTSFSFGGSDLCNGMAVQANGKIVLVGYTNTNTNDFAVARLNANGSLDTGFGGNNTGKLTIDFGFDDRASSVAIQSDGKIVVAGSDDGGSADFAFARLNTDGSLDSSFGASGKTSYSFGGHDFCTSVAIQSDGKIVAAGYTDAVNSGNDMAVLRLNPNDGSLDTSFDTDGKQTINFGSDDRANAVLIQGDGKIVLAGSYDGGASDFAVARLNTNGSLDTSFSGDGKANFTFGSGAFGGAEFATAVVQQKDGKLVVGGYTDSGTLGGPNNFGVLRLQADGTLDTSFNGTGKQTVDFGGDDKAYGMALQGDGKIVLAGTTTFGGSGTNTHNFALARLIGRDTDLIGRTSDGEWFVNHITGSSFNVTAATVLWDESAGWKDVQTGDFNGDGLADVIGRDNNGNWWVLLNNGDGSYNTTHFTKWNEAAGWQDVKVGDFNGDGKTDVAGRTNAGEWWVGISDGKSFATTKWAGWVEAAGWHDVLFADFNGDGKLDVAGRTNAGEWWVGLSNGTAFTTSKWATWVESAGWKDVSVGDFNGDGKIDIAGRTSSGEWWVGTSNGSSFTTSKFATWTEAVGWKDVVFADFDGDGKTDVAGRAGTGEWFVGTSTGSAFSTTKWAGWTEAAGWHDTRFGDFNGDGLIDVASRTSTGEWYVGTSTGTTFNTSLWASWTEGAGWKDVLSGSYVG